MSSREVYGITIDKNRLSLNELHLIELNQLNISVYEDEYVYILCDFKNDNQAYLKNRLMRIRNKDIYNSYNDDFGPKQVYI